MVWFPPVSDCGAREEIENQKLKAPRGCGHVAKQRSRDMGSQSTGAQYLAHIRTTRS